MRLRFGENFVDDDAKNDLKKVEDSIGKTVLNASFKNVGLKLLRKLSV